MAVADIDTSLPRALDNPDVIMYDPAETIPEEGDLGDSVPNITREQRQ